MTELVAGLAGALFVALGVILALVRALSRQKQGRKEEGSEPAGLGLEDTEPLPPAYPPRRLPTDYTRGVSDGVEASKHPGVDADIDHRVEWYKSRTDARRK